MVRDVFHSSGWSGVGMLADTSERSSSTRTFSWLVASFFRCANCLLPCMLPLIWAKLRYLRRVAQVSTCTRNLPSVSSMRFVSFVSFVSLVSLVSVVSRVLVHKKGDFQETAAIAELVS